MTYSLKVTPQSMKADESQGNADARRVRKACKKHLADLRRGYPEGIPKIGKIEFLIPFEKNGSARDGNR